MTFIVNRDGKVFEKDLGKNTARDRLEDDRFRSGPGLEGSGALRIAALRLSTLVPNLIELEMPMTPTTLDPRRLGAARRARAARRRSATGRDTRGRRWSRRPARPTLRHERQIVATVEAVDAAKRQVTLKGPKGNVVPLTVGPDVRNLAQVKVGDRFAFATPRPCR